MRSPPSRVLYNPKTHFFFVKYGQSPKPKLCIGFHSLKDFTTFPPVSKIFQPFFVARTGHKILKNPRTLHKPNKQSKRIATGPAFCRFSPIWPPPISDYSLLATAQHQFSRYRYVRLVDGQHEKPGSVFFVFFRFTSMCCCTFCAVIAAFGCLPVYATRKSLVASVSSCNCCCRGNGCCYCCCCCCCHCA